MSGGTGIIRPSMYSSWQSRRHGGRRAMLVFEDVREGVLLTELLLLLLRRIWKLENLGRDDF